MPLTSTFVNRNTAADYFGACSALWLLLACEWVRRLKPKPGISRELAWVQRPRLWFARLIFLMVMMFICLLATFMTASKAGVGLTFLSLAIAVVAFFYRDLPGRRGVFTALAAASATAALLAPLVAGNVILRFIEQGIVDPTRLSLYRSTLRMIADHPWFGTGAWDICLGFSSLPI